MELVVIKFGGGLITEKSKLCTPNLTNIRNLCDVVKRIQASKSDGKEYKVILIHGAGSYGHLKARAWKLNQGKLKSNFKPDGIKKVNIKSHAESRIKPFNFCRIRENGLDFAGGSCGLCSSRHARAEQDYP